MSLFQGPWAYFDVLRDVEWVSNPITGRDELPDDATDEQKEAYKKYRDMVEKAQRDTVIIEE